MSKRTQKSERGSARKNSAGRRVAADEIRVQRGLGALPPTSGIGDFRGTGNRQFGASVATDAQLANSKTHRLSRPGRAAYANGMFTQDDAVMFTTYRSEDS